MSGLLSHYILSVLTFPILFVNGSTKWTDYNAKFSTFNYGDGSIGTFRKILAINEKYMQAEYGMCSRNRMGSEHLELHL